MNQIIQQTIDEQQGQIRALAKDIFEHPELALEEYYACEHIAAYLRENGFAVETSDVQDKGGRHNCVIGAWGGGKPVIGILGEYDALPGCGQTGGVPYEDKKDGPGHGCTHNLSSPAGCAAAIALKRAMEAEGLSGTVKFFGCPAEEISMGKTLMTARGDFDGVDAAILYHGGGMFRVALNHYAACSDYIFEFYGRAAHAAMSPELGRSALDAAELMSVGVQYLREHIPAGQCLHHVYLHGGLKPNIVPDFASVQYYIRARSRTDCDELIRRVKLIARGAAMMTETEVKIKRVNSGYENIRSETLEAVLQRVAEPIPEVAYTDEDRRFVSQLYQYLHQGQGKKDTEALLAKRIIPMGGPHFIMGSSDVCEVSQVVPIALFQGGASVEGRANHSWSTTTGAGSEYGYKAPVYAARVMAEYGYELLRHPEIVEQAKAELREKRAGMPPYQPLLACEEA